MRWHLISPLTLHLDPDNNKSTARKVMAMFAVRQINQIIEKRIQLSEGKTLVLSAPLGWGVFEGNELRFDGKYFDVFKSKKAAQLQCDFLNQSK